MSGLKVQSYPELYTMFIGWAQYESIWGILSATGLVLFPFIALFVRNFAEPYQSQAFQGAGKTSLKRIEFQCLSMLLIATFTAVPIVKLDPQVLTFNPTCDTERGEVRPGDTGTTYDKAFGHMNAVKVPIFWYGVIGLSQGITIAARQKLKCPTHLRGLRTEINTSRIQSPHVAAEVKEFADNCHIPARSKLMSKYEDIRRYTKEYGKSDVEWIGSRSLLNIAGYYDTLLAPRPIQGFPYQENRDFEQGVNNQWGTPTCKAWWEHPQHGLYHRLQQEIRPTLIERIRNITSRRAIDDVIRNTVKNSVLIGYSNVPASRHSEDFGAMIPWLVKSVSFPLKLTMLTEMLPIIQSVLLMSCYMLLPFVLVLSSYRLSAIVGAAFSIAAIIFWHYLWQLISYVDDVLIHALYPHLFDFSNDSTSPQGGRRIAVEISIGMLYLLLPAFLSVYVGQIGMRIGSSLQSALTQSARGKVS